MTFNELVDEYEKSVLSTGVKRSANTDLSKIRKYLRPLLGDKKLAGMTEADILSYLHNLDLKPATRNRHLALIKAVFTWAIRMGYISRSPALYIKALPEVTSDRRAMDDSQLQRWMEVCECWRNGKPDHEGLALLMFLALTGLRLGKPVIFVLRMWTGVARLSPCAILKTANSAVYRYVIRLSFF
ncbi:tyrosine-type recombinase/integrase [Escherichia coli]|uniref:tyrosine-type recombinase/integrase n=1 Tax=Escherichia coli TaxID=562 RepID=UPI00388F304D